jgi:hypothetical protein
MLAPSNPTDSQGRRYRQWPQTRSYLKPAPIFQFFTDEIYRELLLVSISAMRKANLSCRNCSATVWSGAMRCDFCGVSHPNSELRAAILSPGAFAFCTFAVTVFITFWFWQ